MVLTEILERNAREHPDAPAVTMRMGYRTVSFTYKQLYDFARKTACFLEEQGIGKGDCVMLCAPNSPYWVALFWACQLRGAPLVPLNTQSTSEAISKIADQTEARIMFHHQFFKSELDEKIKCFRIELLPEFVEEFDPSACEPVALQEDDLLEIMYTSGTTGDPKGVMLTHKNVGTNLKAVSKIIEFEPKRERLLSILPLSHVLEQTFGLVMPSHFVSHVIYTHSHGAIKTLLHDYKITKLIAVPEFLQLMLTRVVDKVEERGGTKTFNRLLDLSRKVGRPWFSRLLFRRLHKSFGGHLDTIACGGAPLDPALEDTWRAFGFHVLQGYGLTETSPLITCNTYEEHRSGSVGKTVDYVEARIAEEGEIQVKGDSVFSGYYNNPAKTKEVFTEDGWFKLA